MKEIEKIIEEKCYVDKRNGDEFEFEIFCDYDEQLGDESLAKISRAEDPEMEFEEIMEDWRIRAEDEYYYPEMYKIITSELEDYDDDEVREYVISRKAAIKTSSKALQPFIRKLNGKPVI